MSSIRKAVKKTLIETDITKKVLAALTEKDPREIVKYMATNTPRTLVDIMKRMDGAVSIESDEVHAPSEVKGRTDWADIKASLEAMYETGEYTAEDLVDAAVDMTEGAIDRYTARMLVAEIFK